MLLPLALILAASIPVVALLLVFYLEDRHEPEPPANLAKYFAIGLLTYAVATGVHALTPAWRGRAADPLTDLLTAILLIGLVEELAKYAGFRLAAHRDRELDEPYDGCIYGAYVGLGFAWVENLTYVFSASDARLAFGIAALRCATAVPAHALFGAIWGLAFGLARFNRRYRWWQPAALLSAILIHGAYDFVADRSTRLGNNLLGYFALLAQLALLAFAAIEGIRLAHRHSPHRSSPSDSNMAA